MFIPKILHQIWIGNKPMPEKYLKYQESWKRFNPDWKFVLWNNENIKELKFFSQRAYDNCINWAEKADYLRIVILVEFGGIYADVDVECLKPIDQLIEKYEFVVGFEDDGWIGNAIIGSTSQNQIITNLLGRMQEKILSFSAREIYDTYFIGVRFFSDYLKRYLDDSLKYKIYDKNVFFPLPDGYMLFGQGVVSKESFTMHRATHSWGNKKQKIGQYLCRIRFFRFLLKFIKKFFYSRIPKTYYCNKKINDIKIGFILTTYNRNDLLIRAIESVFISKDPEDIVVVINDYPDDHNLEFLLKKYIDNEKFIYIKNNFNLGLNQSRNIGLEILLKKVDYITFLDDDDFIIEGAVKKFKNFALNNQYDWYLLPVRFSDNTQTYIKNFYLFQDYLLNYAIGYSIRRDAAHIISTEIIGDVRFPERIFQNEQCIFFEELSKKTFLFTVPIVFLSYNYQLDGMTLNKYYSNIKYKVYPRFYRILRNISWLPYLLKSVFLEKSLITILFYCIKTTKDILILAYYLVFMFFALIFGQRIIQSIVKNIIKFLF